MKKLLTTSAMVMALAIGTTGTAGATEATSHHKYGGGIHKRMEETLAKLPEDKAKTFRETMQKSREQNKATWSKLRDLKKEQKALITAPSFDKGAYLAKAKQIQALFAEMHATKTAAFAEALSHLNQEERTTVMESMKHRFHRKGQHDGAKPAEVKE